MSNVYPTDRTFSRQDITRLAGVEDDVLGFWLRAGLLKPLDREDDGRKRRRRFSYVQIHVAAVLSELRRLGVNIGGLRSFAELLQRGIQLAGYVPLHSSSIHDAAKLASRLHRYRSGEVQQVRINLPHEKALELIRKNPGANLRRDAESEQDIIDDMVPGDHDTPEQVVAFARCIASDDVQAIRLFAELTDREHLVERGVGRALEWDEYTWVAWLRADGTWAVTQPDVGLGDAKAFNQTRSGMFLVLSLIVRDAWDRERAAGAGEL